MTTPAFEAFLARIYTDAEARRRFLQDPEREARSTGLNDAEVLALMSIDREGLRLAIRSYAAKRKRKYTR